MSRLRDLLARYHAERGGSLAATVEGVRALSAMFNGVTPFRPGYMADRALRRAYVHYYLPVNAEKVARVLAELESYAPAPRRVLDFGCGPGTAALALLLRGKKIDDLTLVDVVDEALDDAAFLARELGASPRALHEPPDEKFDLILAANVYSETRPRLEELLADRGHLVVLEPALKESTRRLMEWRDDLAARGFRIAAPCLGRARCPMLEHADLWCHQDLPWPRPAPVAEVDRRLGLDKESLKFAYAVVTPKGPTLADGPARTRLVSNLHKEKGKAWAWLCGRDGPLCRAEMLTRHRSDANLDFFRADRGDLLDLEAAGLQARIEGPVRRVILKENPDLI